MHPLNPLSDACVSVDQLVEMSNNVRILGTALTMENIMPNNKDRHEWKELKVDKGRAFLRVIDNHKELGIVCDNIATPGTTFPKHTHEGTEVFFVYHGVMNLHLCDQDKWIKIGGDNRLSFEFDATEPHEAKFDGHCYYWAITKPPDKFWK